MIGRKKKKYIFENRLGLAILILIELILLINIYMHDVLNSPFFDIQTRQNFFNERIFTKTRDNFPLLFHPQPHENAMERV